MPLPKPHMDLDLLEVGSWFDKRALDQESLMLPRQKQNENHHLHPSAEPHKGYRSERTESTGPSRQKYHNRHPKSEYQLLTSLTQEAVKAIQRQHPACFMKAEGGQRGNQATAKTPGSLSRPERCPQIRRYPRLLGESEVLVSVMN
ncbi:hypothetical protein GGR58DRAFT_518636 [Xylaria digitata]|nr:hypothetical protein GGR58DRAFT_518636 [Xylaria digitata]